MKEPLENLDSPSDGVLGETSTSMPGNSSHMEAPFEPLSNLTESTSSPPVIAWHCTTPPPRKRSRGAHDESPGEVPSSLMCTINKTLESFASQEDAISTYCRLIEHRMRQLPQDLLPHFENEVDNCFFKYYVQSVTEVKVQVKTEEQD